MTNETLSDMRSSHLGDYTKENLTDISLIEVDKSKPVSQRMRDFVKAVGNPYMFKVGDISVKLNFNPNGKNISDAVAEAVKHCIV